MLGLGLGVNKIPNINERIIVHEADWSSDTDGYTVSGFFASDASVVRTASVTIDGTTYTNVLECRLVDDAAHSGVIQLGSPVMAGDDVEDNVRYYLEFDYIYPSSNDSVDRIDAVNIGTVSSTKQTVDSSTVTADVLHTRRIQFPDLGTITTFNDKIFFEIPRSTGTDTNSDKLYLTRVVLWRYK